MSGLHEVLEWIRSLSDSESHKGRIFERLMKKFFETDHIYADRFSKVYLWSEFTVEHEAFSAQDIGIDLVAKEREGGYCAIQCKCYAKGTRISKGDIDSFISASNREPFTSRIIIDTGDEWGENAIKAVRNLKPRCQILDFAALEDSPIHWPDLSRELPENLDASSITFNLRPHQQEAFDDVIAAFKKSDRGKLIMACGTGKTFTALRIAEKIAGIGGRVLYLVPSISLLQQSMREWSQQRGINHHYYGICSDTKAGRTTEDAQIEELEIPVTTNEGDIAAALKKKQSSAMTVVFCTYQSLELVARAQRSGAPAFDIALCDEAHRTTGVERVANVSEQNDASTSPFLLIHDSKKIKCKKRLYMTATPRLYTQGSKTKANEKNIGLYSMDDESIFGAELYRLKFSEAIEKDLLSDYKVVVFAVSEQHEISTLHEYIEEHSKEINISDTAKIVGCWRALQDPENKAKDGKSYRSALRAIAFSSTILSSKRLELFWESIIKKAAASLPREKQDNQIECKVKHVDGTDNALNRKKRIEWLKGSENNTCRILSNARCLSEGIDVPALDAVLFFNSRSSIVDIVQAVGRAMRKDKGKEFGYIILPVAIPPDEDPEKALNDNKRFQVVWEVLRALRSHDDRLDNAINKIDLNKKLPKQIIVVPNGNGEGQLTLPFPTLDLPADAINAKIVEKCGDRQYWDKWAKDVAEIFSRLVFRINQLIERGGGQRFKGVGQVI